ncbi:MAG: ABC transporter ATP-binding protein [Candidatus Limiplasma sp.]|nr:ABC transporter ATP-binding protein [Candidatus Limiplasma sp.]
MALLEVKNLQKIYTTRFGAQKVQALRDVNFTVEAGEFIAIMGESGSGKTTLLNILAALDKPTAGQVLLEGRSFADVQESERAAFRRDNLGFVFQDFNLLDTFSVRDNILLPLVLQNAPLADMDSRLPPLVTELGLQGLESKFPYELSGGQKQRTAVARALITNPRLLLADEPTGALDSKASARLMRQFEGVHARGQTLVMVTHSAQAASYASRVLFIKDGEVYNQLYSGGQTREAFFQKIIATLTALTDGGVAGD